MGKATKLKDMKLTSVDLVKQGANPDANICLYKSAKGEPEEEPTDERSILKQMFDLMKGVFIQEDNSEGNHQETSSIEKDAKSFTEIRTKQNSREMLWKYNDTLNESVRSIIDDSDLDTNQQLLMLNKTLDEYSAAMKELFKSLIDTKTNINTNVDGPVEAAKSANPINEGESIMKYDLTKLSDEEKATFEALQKKCKVADTKKSAEPTEPTTDPAPATNPTPETTPAAPAPVVEKSASDKALEAVQTELAELKKSYAMKELTDVAKKYEPLGKKSDELVNTLYDLKKSGDAGYNAFIAVLDEQLELVNKSGLFTEVGKNTHGPVAKSADEAIQKVEAIAKGYMESDANLDYNSAMTRAWENSPELLKQYENSYKN